MRSARGIRSLEAIGAGAGVVVVIVLEDGVPGVVVVVVVLGVAALGLGDVVGAVALPRLPGALGDCVADVLPRVPPWSPPELDEPVPVLCANERPMVPATKSAATVEARVLRVFILYSIR